MAARASGPRRRISVKMPRRGCRAGLPTSVVVGQNSSQLPAPGFSAARLRPCQDPGHSSSRINQLFGSNQYRARQVSGSFRSCRNAKDLGKRVPCSHFIVQKEKKARFLTIGPPTAAPNWFREKAD
jgi:hypothetical protein